MELLSAHQPGERRQSLRGDSYARGVQPLESFCDARVLAWTFGGSQMPVLGVPAHRNHHDRLLLTQEPLGEGSCDVNGPLYLGDGPFPVGLILSREVHQEVPGKEVRKVGCEAHVQGFSKNRRRINLQVLVREVELQEVGRAVLDQRCVVVVPDRQAPGPAEVEVPPAQRGVPEVPVIEEVPLGDVPRRRSAQQKGKRVRLQPPAWALHGDVRLADDLSLGDRPGGDERLRQVDAVHHLPGGNHPGRLAAHGFLHLADTAHHLGEFLRKEGDHVVITFHRGIHGEVLLDDPRTAGDGGDRHVVAALVAGISHDALTNLGQPVHVGQVDVLERSRIGGLCMEQGEGCSC